MQETTEQVDLITRHGCGASDCQCHGGRSQLVGELPRRGLLGGLAAWLVALGLLPPHRALAAEAPRKQRPQPGDFMVFRRGERKGQPVAVADVAMGGKPIVVYPFDPVNKVMRDGSRLNQLLLLRLPMDQLSEETRDRAADGVIAYSAICSHQNCPVTGWHPEHQQFICPCHETHYDPKDGARVVSGPAKRALPALPLSVQDGRLVATGTLTGRVGRKKRAI